MIFPWTAYAVWRVATSHSGCGCISGTETDTLLSESKVLCRQTEVTPSWKSPDADQEVGRRAWDQRWERRRAGWCNSRPGTCASASRPAHSRVRGTQPRLSTPGLAPRGSAPPAWPGLKPDSAPHIPESPPTSRPGGIRGPGAHLIFLADVDERRDTHGEGPGTVDVALANHADRKKELGRAAAPHKRFRVTHRGPCGAGSSTGAEPRRPIPARILAGGGARRSRGTPKGPASRTASCRL